MEPGIDFLAVDDHELLVAVECIRELGVLGLYQDATLVAIGRIEQSKIDLAENPPSPNMSVERNAFGLRLPPKRAGFAGRMGQFGNRTGAGKCPWTPGPFVHVSHRRMYTGNPWLPCPSGPYKDFVHPRRENTFVRGVVRHRRTVAFSPSPYSRFELFVAVGDVLRAANPTDPATVTTRAFDKERAAAGHPRCPTAKVICYERLKLAWPELKAIALDPKRDIAITVARRFQAVGAGRNLSLAEVVLALRTVAMRLRRRTLARPEYKLERERMIRADRRAYRHGGVVTLPTADQVTRVAGSWAEALAAAGLEESTGRALQSVPIEEMLDLHFKKHGFVISADSLGPFAAAEGLRVQHRGARRWSEIVEAWRSGHAERGFIIPPRPKRVRRISYGPPVAWELTDRSKVKWTDDELVDVLVRSRDTLGAGEELDEDRYDMLREEDNRLPSPNTFRRGKRLGFAHYRELARQRRLAALATS
jgi:hypothetical protein